MNINEKKSILVDILGDYESRSGEILFFCPNCSHKKRKLSFNFTKDKFQCWVCEYSGNSIKNFVKKYGNYEQLKSYTLYEEAVTFDSVYKNIFNQKEKINHVATCSLPEEYEFIYYSNSKFAKKALNYLINIRNITEQDIYKWKIGICAKGDYYNRIIIPSFNSAGNCNFFVARSIDENPKYPYLYAKVEKSHIIFNELNINWNNPIFLTEGCFDGIKISKNVIPLIGKTIPFDEDHYSKLIEKIIIYKPTIYLCFDTDIVDNQPINRSINIANLLLQYNILDNFILDPLLVRKKDFGELDDIEKRIVMNNPERIMSKYDLIEKQINMIEVSL